MTRGFTRMMGVSPSEYRREVLVVPVRHELGARIERPVPLGTVTRLPRTEVPVPPPRPYLQRGSGAYRPVGWPGAV